MVLNVKHKNRNYEVLIDDEDSNRILGYSLNFHIGTNTNYIRCSKNSKYTYLHRLISNAPTGLFVDHINGDGLDNRKCNLQICSMKENSRKRRKTTGKFKYKGITHRKNLTKGYRAKIRVDRKHIHLGYYSSLEEAANAYNKAALKYFGKFAILNEIK